MNIVKAIRRAAGQAVEVHAEPVPTTAGVA
jgi:hypothetical protein